MRFSAAIGVVTSHSGKKSSESAGKSNPSWGDLAVPIFFVLSGFIIRLAHAYSREANPREYLPSTASQESTPWSFRRCLPPCSVPAFACCSIVIVSCTTGPCFSAIRSPASFSTSALVSQIWGLNSILLHQLAFLVSRLRVHLLRLLWFRNLPARMEAHRRMHRSCPVHRPAGHVSIAALVARMCWMYDAYHRIREQARKQRLRSQFPILLVSRLRAGPARRNG